MVAWSMWTSVWSCVCLQVKSVLTTLSGEELAKLREELEDIKEPFTLTEFDDEVEDDTRGKEVN